MVKYGKCRQIYHTWMLWLWLVVSISHPRKIKTHGTLRFFTPLKKGNSIWTKAHHGFRFPKDHWTLKTGYFGGPYPCYTGSNPSIGGSKILRVPAVHFQGCISWMLTTTTTLNSRDDEYRSIAARFHDFVPRVGPGEVVLTSKRSHKVGAYQL